MTRTLGSIVLACLFLCSTNTLIGQSAVSSQADINVVRATYAKLEFAVRFEAIRAAALGALRHDTVGQVATSDKLLIQPLTLGLSEMKTGPVGDLESIHLSDLATVPAGRTFDAIPGTWSYRTEDGRQFTAAIAELHWKDSTFSFAQDWNQPVGQLTKIGALDPGYERYVSYTVKASYGGEERQYHALFLFGHDAKGPIILPLDGIVGNSVLLSTMDNPAIPDALQVWFFHGRSDAMDLLRSMLAPASCSPEPRTQMCCDETSGRCGITVEVLRSHGLDADAVTSPRLH